MLKQSMRSGFLSMLLCAIVGSSAVSAEGAGRVYHPSSRLVAMAQCNLWGSDGGNYFVTVFKGTIL